jgi:hypothetical protein
VEGAGIPAEDVIAEVKFDPLCIIRIQATAEEPVESRGATNATHPLFAGSSSNLIRGPTSMNKEARKYHGFPDLREYPRR